MMQIVVVDVQASNLVEDVALDYDKISDDVVLNFMASHNRKNQLPEGILMPEFFQNLKELLFRTRFRKIVE